MSVQQSDWFSDPLYDAILTASGGLYQHFRSLANKLATCAISASKHGIYLVNEFFIYSEDITSTLSPEYFKGWRIFKMTVAMIRLKLCSKLLRIVNEVITFISSRSDQLTAICFSPN